MNAQQKAQERKRLLDGLAIKGIIQGKVERELTEAKIIEIETSGASRQKQVKAFSDFISVLQNNRQ